MNPGTAAFADMVHVSRPHPARIYDYLLGGKDNRAADREAAAKIIAVAPEIRDMARANRAFLQRAVRYLARALSGHTAEAWHQWQLPGMVVGTD